MQVRDAITRSRALLLAAPSDHRDSGSPCHFFFYFSV